MQGKIALVTGAGSGIGRAVAVRLARCGASVVVSDVNLKTAQETGALLGDRLHSVVQCDVADADAVARLFAPLQTLDILINNAGAVMEYMPIQDVPVKAWDQVLAVNLNGSFYCMREAMRRMVPRRSGVIVNVSSTAGLHGFAGAGAYTAAKGAIVALTRSVASEAAPHGIRVNCIAPGWIDTPLLGNLPRERLAGMAPLGRVGQPDEVAAVVQFLASDEASFMVGQCVSPNGGLHM
ncbi:MAG: SDR family NAD(P)-dependent oxidoreductase [Candidatus Xenobia bacterium]